MIRHLCLLAKEEELNQSVNCNKEALTLPRERAECHQRLLAEVTVGGSHFVSIHLSILLPLCGFLLLRNVL